MEDVESAIHGFPLETPPRVTGIMFDREESYINMEGVGSLRVADSLKS